MFQLQRAIIRPKTEQSPGTFNDCALYGGVSQPLGRGLVLGPGINYTGPREALLEFVILFF